MTEEHFGKGFVPVCLLLSVELYAGTVKLRYGPGTSVEGEAG